MIAYVTYVHVSFFSPPIHISFLFENARRHEWEPDCCRADGSVPIFLQHNSSCLALSNEENVKSLAVTRIANKAARVSKAARCVNLRRTLSPERSLEGACVMACCTNLHGKYEKHCQQKLINAKHPL